MMSTNDGERLAKALGVFSVGLGLALLGRALGSRRRDQRRVVVATAAVAGIMILDILASRRLSRDGDGLDVEARPRRHGIRVRKAITIDRSPAELYRFWRNIENLPRFMAHLESVRELDQRRSYWKVRAPLGTTVEWTAEIVEDRPDELISWRSVEGAQVPNSGVVRFVPAPGGRGAEVHFEISYSPPAGLVGTAIATLFGKEPGRQVDGDLRRLKQMLEAGERVPDELRPDASRGFGPRNGGLE
jgi:uncharacterized membrane protein